MIAVVRLLLCCAFIVPALFAGQAALAQARPAPGGNTFKPGASMDGQSKKIEYETTGKGKQIRYKKQTDVNFDDTTIEGSAKSPFASILTTRDQDFNKGFIKIRYDWHDQLIMSVSGLSQ